MKIYCNLCEKVQPVIIDNCRDAKTNEPFQDIVCKECHLVIAAGTDIQREWVGLTDEERTDIRGRVQEYTAMDNIKYGLALQIATEQALKEKNT